MSKFAMTLKTLRFVSRYCGLLLLSFLALLSYGVAESPYDETTKGQDTPICKDYYALVVGVGNYDTWPRLPHPVRDAQEVASFLREMGFGVMLVTDPTATELKKALEELVHKTALKQDRGIVFYYTGHGETETLADGTKLGWIIPRDCPLLREDPSGFAARAISTKALETYSLQMRSRHVLMLFDSSFAGDVFALESPGIVSKRSTAPIRQYIIAGKENEPIPNQSIFKRALIEGLQGSADLICDGYISGSELAFYLADTVVKRTNGRQHPQYGKINNPALTRGDFIFELARLVKTEPSKGRLFVETKPKDALVRILNIKPRFCQGIALEHGEYHLEASAAEHQTTNAAPASAVASDKTARQT